MGSPLALVPANIFMDFPKSKWLNEYNLNKPKFYLRYVDDILATFDDKQDSLNFLNSRHDKIIYNKLCNRFYNNYVISICPKPLYK